MDGQAFGNNGIDSITLGQLKSLVGGGSGGGQNNVKQKVHLKKLIKITPPPTHLRPFQF